MKDTVATTTAGVRGSYWDPKKLPENVTFTPLTFVAEDGANSFGQLASIGNKDTVALAMHPREYLPNNYLVPELLKANISTIVQAPRSVGNDVKLEHEVALLDVAAGIRKAKELGYKKVILIGMSGGAGLFSFYLQQANLTGDKRLANTPAGKPVKLPKADLPVADGLILISPHPGQGKLLMNCIDPSVTDEDDATSIDITLSPFSPKNGFRKPPESSDYSEEFITRYREAQRERVARIDEWAKAAVKKRIAAKEALYLGEITPQNMVISNHVPIKTIWRTDADLRCFDLSIEPTDRGYGSLWGPNPFVSNLGSIGFARTVTPDSWLSTWSGISSNATLEETIKGVSQPTFMLRFSGDNSVFPSEVDTIFKASSAEDKVIHVCPGNHHGRPVKKDDPLGQELAGEHIREWINARF